MGSRGASANSSKGAMGGLLDGEYSSRLTKKEGYTGGYKSRYANAKTFTYDGDTFINDGRGGSTKDGKRSMMYPDDILFARANMANDFIKKVNDGGYVSPVSYDSARTLLDGLRRDANKYSHPADVKTSQNIIDALSKALSK